MRILLNKELRAPKMGYFKDFVSVNFFLCFLYTYYFLFANFTYEELHIPRVFECCNFILKRCVCVQGVGEGDGGSLPPPTPPPIMQVVHILRIKIEWCQ